MYPINDEGVALLKESEQFVGFAYPDPVSPLGRALQKAGLWRRVLQGVPIPQEYTHLRGKPWTIGWGFTDNVSPGDVMSITEANTRLARELVPYCSAVLSACTVKPNENQFAALVVCAWNIGIGGIRGSTMVKAHNRGDEAAAARAFRLWNKAGGQVVPGLVKRRAAEAALYLKPVPGDARVDVPQDDEIEPMPQTVEKESSLLRSPIVQGTGATAITTLAALNDTAEKAAVAHSSVSTLASILGGIYPYWPYIAMAAVVIVAGTIIWYRVLQRKGGWA